MNEPRLIALLVLRITHHNLFNVSQRRREQALLLFVVAALLDGMGEKEF
jgi:hypothetical protein